MEDGRSRQREGPGTKGIPGVHTLPPAPSHALLLGIISVVSPFVNHSSHPIQLPAAFSGRHPAPWAGSRLHKHHLTARLVLIVLALPCVYHPARRTKGVKALSFTSCSSKRHLTALLPPTPNPPLMSPCPQRCQGCPAQVLLSRPSCPVVWVDPSWVRGEQLSTHLPKEVTRNKPGLLKVPTLLQAE